MISERHSGHRLVTHITTRPAVRILQTNRLGERLNEVFLGLKAELFLCPEMKSRDQVGRHLKNTVVVPEEKG